MGRHGLDSCGRGWGQVAGFENAVQDLEDTENVMNFLNS